jgi:hypothetical protein
MCLLDVGRNETKYEGLMRINNSVAQSEIHLCRL